jgi:hypothetical protein
MTVAVTVIVSLAVAATACVIATFAVELTPTRTGAIVCAVTAVAATVAADAGATDVSTPKPREALSISRSREFPPLGFG